MNEILSVPFCAEVRRSRSGAAMGTFRALDDKIGLVPAAVARTLGEIDAGRGREDAFRLQQPEVLEARVDVARVQSTEASNAIEHIVAPRKRIEEPTSAGTTRPAIRGPGSSTATPSSARYSPACATTAC